MYVPNYSPAIGGGCQSCFSVLRKKAALSINNMRITSVIVRCMTGCAPGRHCSRVHAVMGVGAKLHRRAAFPATDTVWQPTPQTPTKPPSDPHDGVVPTPF
eukprot:COSAG01_NODE_2160_length_8268_cov_230.522830_3_plen_101_part_00